RSVYCETSLMFAEVTHNSCLEGTSSPHPAIGGRNGGRTPAGQAGARPRRIRAASPGWARLQHLEDEALQVGRLGHTGQNRVVFGLVPPLDEAQGPARVGGRLENQAV